MESKRRNRLTKSLGDEVRGRGEEEGRPRGGGEDGRTRGRQCER